MADITPLKFAPGPLYALTLWQPMAFAIAIGKKPIENRPWPPPQKLIGSWIAIHAGQTFNQAHWRFIREQSDKTGRWFDANHPLYSAAGAVIAVAHLAGFISGNQHDPLNENHPLFWEGVDHFDRAKHYESPWYFGPFGWVLDVVHPLREPVRCRGFQRLWRLPPDVDLAVRASAITSKETPA
jgi:hypothetical protein